LIGPTVSPVEHGENGSFLADSWIQASFSNPCMFHAVLLAASSHLDVIRKELNNPITDYHRRNTVQLLVNNISSSEKIPYTSMAATMYLWQYDVSQSPLC
jgi:hypothetical protein